MSINFEKPVSPEVVARMRKIFMDRLVASDDQTALVDAGAFRGADMSDIARLAKQPATLVLHGDGEIVTLKDGTTYRVTPRGWRKVESGEEGRVDDHDNDLMPAAALIVTLEARVAELERDNRIALAEADALREAIKWLWRRCKIVCWPQRWDPPAYPLEHDESARKDSREAIEHEMRQELAALRGDAKRQPAVEEDGPGASR